MDVLFNHPSPLNFRNYTLIELSVIDKHHLYLSYCYTDALCWCRPLSIYNNNNVCHTFLKINVNFCHWLTVNNRILVLDKHCFFL